MLYKKLLKEENAKCAAHTLGDLIRNFNIELNGFFLELDEFPVDDKYNVTYDNYYIIEVDKNTVHVFNGRVINVSDSLIML